MKLRYNPNETLNEEEELPTLRQSAKEVPIPLTKTLEVRVIQLAKNPRFVYADLEGNRIAVAVPQKISARLQGKIIRVIATDNADETVYTYQP